MTAKGSNRTLDSKTPPKIVNHGYATQHVTEAFWANRRVRHVGYLSARHTSVVFEVMRAKTNPARFQAGSA